VANGDEIVCYWGCHIRKGILWERGGRGADHARVVLPVVDWHISTTACIVAIGEELAHEVL
jgi:hypothetical protein